jgi:hypothetical protein
MTSNDRKFPFCVKPDIPKALLPGCKVCTDPPFRANFSATAEAGANAPSRPADPPALAAKRSRREHGSIRQIRAEGSAGATARLEPRADSRLARGHRAAHGRSPRPDHAGTLQVLRRCNSVLNPRKVIGKGGVLRPQDNAFIFDIVAFNKRIY